MVATFHAPCAGPPGRSGCGHFVGLVENGGLGRGVELGLTTGRKDISEFASAPLFVTRQQPTATVLVEGV